MKFTEICQKYELEEHVVLCWERETGWSALAGNNAIFDVENMQIKGIEGIKQYVSKADEILTGVFVSEILDLIENPDKMIKKSFSSIPVHFIGKAGQSELCNVQYYVLRDSQGSIGQIVVQIREMTAEEKYRVELAKIVTNDKNPQAFNLEVKELLDKYPEDKFAVIQFDVKRFKMINANYGEHFGDELLNYFVDTLSLLCRKDQLYVRLTADVFMILTKYKTKEDIIAFIEMINNRLSGYKEVEYQLVFGVAYIDDREAKLRKFGDGAAMARQNIKGDAINYIAFFSEDMRSQARNKKFIEDNMKNALKNEEFVMYLQPKYDISNQKMVGAEALVRWIHPDKGMISPGDFIPLFEQNGFVTKLDAYIWEQACKQIRLWIDRKQELIPISVNVSRRHLHSMDFINTLNSLIDKYDIPKKYLEIEITESIDNDEKDEKIDALKANGYVLLMDDFGSGYSSLNMLKDTQFDGIKIDRMFLQNFIASSKGQKIVEHTIQMSKDIGLDIVAEGVETKEEAAFLLSCGCRVAQGFLYARPMPIKEFEELHI